MTRHRFWHTLQERRVIRRHGGKALRKYGYDGLLRGRPVEVRAVRKDRRYRIQQDVHRILVRRRGAYIFVSGNGKSRVVSAKRVSRMLGRGQWFEDRDYPHKFLPTRKVFRPA